MEEDKTSEKEIKGQQYLAKYEFFIEFSQRDFQNEGGSLYDFDDYDKVNDEAINTITKTIDSEFNNQVQYHFDGTVNAKLERIEPGSIVGTVVLIIGAGLSIVEFISKYKDFYDSLVLLRSQLQSLINRAIYRRFGGQVNSRTSVIIVRNQVLSEPLRPVSSQLKLPQIYSIAFFWYLIVMNFLLIVAISALVIPAIQRVYLTIP